MNIFLESISKNSIVSKIDTGYTLLSYVKIAENGLHFYFFFFSFILFDFLFLEQLGLGLIGHIVTSVT